MAQMETHLCSICFNVTAEDPCVICRDDTRDRSVIAVVVQPSDVLVLEKSSFKGRYHVLHGIISPRSGIGPNQLRIRELIDRVRQGGVSELILWTPHSLDGDHTAFWIIRELDSAGLLRAKLL